MDIVVPPLGESIVQGVITSWLRKSGDTVREGEPLFDLETDKATVEVPSPFAGELAILAPEGSEVAIGQKVATVEVAAATGQPSATAESSLKSTAAPLPPSVRRIVEEKGLDAAAIVGTGKGGRVTKHDALGAAEPVAAEKTDSAVAPARDEAARRDLPTQTRTPMTTLRKRAVQRLVESRRESVHVTTFNEIDMTKVIEIRSHFQESFEKEHGIRIGYTSFFVKACCAALRLHPELNAQVDGDDILTNNVMNIGIAVSIDRGLIVPVIRDADTLTFAQIESAVATMAKRARDKKLLPHELQGGTFTITNGGIFGSLMSTPVPAYPQSAILGLHAIKKRPVAENDQVVIRSMMYAAVTYDHRIIDGKDAVGFLVKVKEFIEAPDKLLLEM
jgi:2-oxoglutarate dehydrogenase E2 component (dihydrolipoamide succinyltransferase)